MENRGWRPLSYTAHTEPPPGCGSPQLNNLSLSDDGLNLEEGQKSMITSHGISRSPPPSPRMVAPLKDTSVGPIWMTHAGAKLNLPTTNAMEKVSWKKGRNCFGRTNQQDII